MFKNSGVMTGLLAALLLAPAAYAQDPGTQPAKQTSIAKPADKALLEISRLNERIEAVQGSSSLDEDMKARVLDAYKQTVAFTKERDKNTKEAEEFSAFVKVTGSQHLEEIREQERAFTPFDPLTVAPMAEKMSLQDLKNEVDDENATLNELVARIDSVGGELEAAENRRDEISGQISQVEDKLKRLREQPAAKPSGPQAEELAEALQLKQTAERQMLNAESTALRQEGLSIPLKLNVLAAEQELLARQKKNAEERLGAWREALAPRREALAKKRIAEASAVLKKGEAEGWPPFLLEMARNNLTGSQALITVNNNANAAEDNISGLREKLAQVKAKYERTRKQVKSIGLTPTAGVFFGRNLRALSRMRVPTGASAKRRREIKRVTEEQLMLDGLRDDVSRLDDKEIRTRIAALNLPPDRQKELEGQGEILHKQTKQLLGELDVAYPHYLSLLADEGYAERALRLEARSYSNFLNVYLFRTRSNQSFSFSDLLLARKALVHLFSPDNWYGFFGDSLATMKHSPAATVLLLLLLIVWLGAYPRLGRQLNELNHRVGTPGDDSILPTALALGLAVIRTAGLPLVIYLAAKMLWAVPGSQVFTRGVCAALAVSARIIFFAWLTIEVFGSRGIGQMHFRWSETMCHAIGNCARRVLFLVVPLIFFMTIVNTGLSAAARTSLGRVVFMVTMVVFSLILSNPFRKGSPVLSLPLFRKTGGFWAKTRRIWLPLSIALPLLLLVFAALGYYYSCIAIGGGLLRSVVLLLALVFIGAFLHRWRRLDAQRSAGQEPAGPSDRAMPGAGSEWPGQASPELKDQIPILIRLLIVFLALAGLYRIWGQNLPALQILNDVILWTYQVGVGAIDQPLLKSVTLSNLLLCFLILCLTVMVAKNIVGLLDVIVFRRLKVDPGNRYAIGMLSRYVVAGIGITLAFDAIGIGWGKVQWLVAALTVGLGFGLQDIVANFVAGIIILFEKPIRIGDVVTVSGTSGRVTQIQIRSTTITDFNRQETIVPNKTIITEKIVNWSLTDRIIRLIIEVGIAYGSDTEKVQQLLLKIAGENKLVLPNPRSDVLFSKFGDNSLDFELRVFVHTRNHVRARHQLNLAINKAFSEAGIEIPFPQRDAHLDTLRPLDVRIVKEDAAP